MKHKRTAEEKAYLDWLAQWPCLVCLKRLCDQSHQSIIGLSAEARAVTVPWSEAQCGPIELHHAGVRGLGQRSPDSECLPLGHKHHARKFDGGGPESVHVYGKNWFADILKQERQETFATLHELYVRETGGKIE